MKTMDTKKCISLVAALLFLEISSPVEACTCLTFLLQPSVCNANAVLRGKFLEQSQNTGSSPTDVEKGFKVKITEVLKGPQELISVTFIRSMSGTSCEYYHDPNGFNVEYFFTASNNNGALTMSSCSYRVRWSELSPKQILGVKGAYLKGCDCKIKSCPSQPCSSESKTCILEKYAGGDGENQTKNQVCVPKTSTECVWKTIE